MIVSKTKLTSKNRLTLPKAVRSALGVTTGDEVAFEIAGDKVMLRPARSNNPFEKWAGRFRKGRGWTRAQVSRFVRDLRGRDE